MRYVEKLINAGIWLENLKEREGLEGINNVII
jgi:hypothetical protein